MMPADDLMSTPVIEQPEQAGHMRARLQEQLALLIDLQLDLKQAHWNVVGSAFVAVHELLDRLAAGVRDMSDALAERIAVLGGEPRGTVRDIADQLGAASGEGLGRAGTEAHLTYLCGRYDQVIGGHRDAVGAVGPLDPVTEDLLIGQARQLELDQWFLRSHVVEAPPSPRFGFADRPPTPEEEERADALEVPDGVGDAYREMARIGANHPGEGRVP